MWARAFSSQVESLGGSENATKKRFRADSVNACERKPLYNHHVHALPAAGGAAAKGPQAAWADIHHAAQPIDRKAPRCSSTNLNLTAFGARRTGWLFLGCPSPPSRYGPHDEVVHSPAQARGPRQKPHPCRGCALTHLFRVEKPTPRSSATWRCESPLVSAIRTASLRNSSVLPVLMAHLLCRTICAQRSGTKPRQVQFGQGGLASCSFRPTAPTSIPSSRSSQNSNTCSKKPRNGRSRQHGIV